MTFRRAAIAGGGTVAVIALLAWAFLATQRSSQAAELASWHEALRQAQAVRARLARLPVATTGAPQPDRIAVLARSLLVAAGVGQQALAGVQPLGDTAMPGGTWHRQQVLVQLRGLTTQQVATMVAEAARTDPSWAVSAIQLTHAGADDRYDAGLSLTTLYPATP